MGCVQLSNTHTLLPKVACQKSPEQRSRMSICFHITRVHSSSLTQVVRLILHKKYNWFIFIPYYLFVEFYTFNDFKKTNKCNLMFYNTINWTCVVFWLYRFFWKFPSKWNQSAYVPSLSMELQSNGNYIHDAALPLEEGYVSYIFILESFHWHYKIMVNRVCSF